MRDVRRTAAKIPEQKKKVLVKTRVSVVPELSLGAFCSFMMLVCVIAVSKLNVFVYWTTWRTNEAI